MELKSGAEWGSLRRKSSDSLACDRRRTGPFGAAVAEPNGGDGCAEAAAAVKTLRLSAPGLPGQRTGLCCAILPYRMTVRLLARLHGQSGPLRACLTDKPT